MRIISWNVNGIRAVSRNGFTDFVKNENPDVLCVQETKARPEQVDNLLSNYIHFWNSAEKKGYSGTAVFTRIKPLKAVNGMGIHEHDNEGRLITLEFQKFFLVNVYTPNAQHGLARLDYRIKWDAEFLNYIKKLRNSKPVVFCGDMNVAHEEIDLTNPKSNMNNAGFTDEERKAFSRLIEAGFADTFRMFNNESGHYTWWSYMFNARARNIGWRIDYFCMSKEILSTVKGSQILKYVKGSDHCPIALELEAYV